MATRVNRTPGLSTLGESLILRKLRLKSPRREGEANFIGLKRSDALSDVDDPSKSRDNILGKLSILDAAERNLYGRLYNGVDWNVTGDFVDEEIDKQFLLPLSGASIGGGSLGSTVSTTPRIRIEDRISLANSYFGAGSYPGLHSGPDAQFYRSPAPEEIGYAKFSFSGSAVTITELKQTDKTTNLLPSAILGPTLDSVVLDLSGYEVGDGDPVNLSGSGVSLRLTRTGSVWTVESGLDNLTNIRTLLGVSIFNDTYFSLFRQYSVINPPPWYVQDPGPGSVDDNNPATSAKVLRSVNGSIVPFVARGYWYSRGYVETRWTATEQSLIGSNNVTEDSNMRWFANPSPLRGEQYNWGIRWDGYLRIGPGTYGLEVQTNVSVKIDLAVETGTPTYWENVFDTQNNAARESDQVYVSATTFTTDNVDDKFKYFTGSDANDWIAYVPITIRMFRGGPDKADLGLDIPVEPNLFIKTTSVSSAISFYSEEHTISLTGTDGNWTVTGSSESVSRVIAILQNVNATGNVAYRLIDQDESVFVTPVTIALTTDGTTISSNTTGLLPSVSYTLRVSPVRPSQFTNNLTALWKSRIASPSANHVSYEDLVDGSYTPDQQKVPYDLRPEWWKTTEGHPYIRSLSLSSDNTPLDGLVPSGFRSLLQSSAPGLGLYGDGGDPVAYSSRPNIILGESKYSAEDDPGSNYVGIVLTPNRLGEGGRLIVNALPINNATFTAANRLGQNDLGGDPNHKTEAFDNTASEISQLYLWNPLTPDGNENKYYVHADLTAVSADDDPTTLGLPEFSDLAWLSPITVTATEVADDSAFTTDVSPFIAPLTLSVEKLTINAGGTDYDVLAFSTTLESLLIGGDDVSAFSGKYVRFYTESNLAFQYSFVDTGDGASFADVLKLTYDGGTVFNAAQSEIPKPPSDRVTPYGFDLPEYGGGLCYPPYAINNPLLSDIAISDIDLYDSVPSGNYDVFWGDHTKGDLGGNTLTISEKLEFNSAEGIETVIDTLTPSELLDTALNSDDYTHRLRIDVALDPDLYDPDMVEHIGNGERVKDLYYGYVKLDS